MAAPNCAVIFGLVIFLFLPCCIYCEVDQTYIGCYFDTEGNIQIHSSRIKKKPSVFGQAYRNCLTPNVGRVAQWKKKFNQFYCLILILGYKRNSKLQYLNKIFAEI